jgi:hypothetical protein
MKQFIVDRHTTPNTPTLEQVPTDKIPIYETSADADADLENLDVGQIIGIKDTGDELSHPVNVVEEDNLHAVTSNAVSEAISYSTTEHFTGKYWIDGKKIYAITIPFTMTDTETYKNIDTSSLGIQETLKYEIIGNSFRAYYETDTDKLRAWRYSAQYMQVYCGSQYPTRPFSANLYLEYIKTTD